ncbi:hypothetical protein QUF63_05385 [Anaerolineales bacterium HSG25]|nr:hypothetical protein [Anaerolineales bacterium HSG25]
MAKNIAVDFMPPGMLEFSVTDKTTESIETTGYGQVGLGGEINLYAQYPNALFWED